MSASPVDLTAMSAAEIKAFIESQALPAEVTTEQPRDEQGRFISPTAEGSPDGETAPDSETTESEPIVVEREINLGDGSGVQVFRGVGATETEAYTALADELASAQANATKKIRELTQTSVSTNAPDTTTTPENEFLLQQRLLDAPRATIRELFKEEFGMSPTEIKAKLAKADAALEAQTIDRASDAFLAANPDYFVSEQNGRRMVRQLEIEGLPPTTENMQKVYDGLKADGLITPKPAADAPSIRGRSSGLSTRSSTPPPPPKPVDTSKLSLEQLRELAGGYRYSY